MVTHVGKPDLQRLEVRIFGHRFTPYGYLPVLIVETVDVPVDGDRGVDEFELVERLVRVRCPRSMAVEAAAKVICGEWYTNPHVSVTW